MSLFRKSISLHVPPDVIYRALKDTRIEKLFPEFFIGVRRKLTTTSDTTNKEEVGFETRTHDGQVQVKEIFKLKVSGENTTEVKYTTETNVENNLVVDSIVQTHVANVLYALLMLETGYINGLTQKSRE
jgi:hypothetical protein